MEYVLENILLFCGNVVVCLDVLGLMKLLIIGYCKGVISKICCVDVVGLIVVVVLCNYLQVCVLLFECDVVDVQFDVCQLVMYNV